MVQKISNIRIIIRFIIGFIIYGAIVFGAAGTLNWPEAWIFFIIYFSFAIILVVWLKKNNPELLKERMTIYKKSAKRWDKIIMLISIPFFIGLVIVPGLETVRFEWTDVSLSLEILGFIGIIIAYITSFLVMKENTYLSRVVEIQKERGHKVITTGPYKYVRHPLYVAVIIMFFCIPLSLGSLYALIASAFLTIIIIIRTVLEDKLLHKELEGYKEYAKKTRYRLLPGIW